MTEEQDDIPQELLHIRQSIDNFDAALIHILAERFRCVRRVSHLKAERGMHPVDPQRERSQALRLRKLAETSGLNPDFAENILNFIIREAVRDHEDVAAKSGLQQTQTKDKQPNFKERN